MKYNLQPSDFFLQVDALERIKGFLPEDFRYKADLSQQFHSDSYVLESIGSKVTIITNFLGLVGALGELPTHYTDAILRLLKNKNSSISEFYDIFHHRLVKLFYQAWRQNQLSVDYRSVFHKRRFKPFIDGMLGFIDETNNYSHRHPVLYFNPVHNHEKLKFILQDSIPDPVEVTLGLEYREEIPEIYLAKISSNYRKSINMNIGDNWLLGNILRMDHVFFEVKIYIHDMKRYCFLVRTKSFSGYVTNLINGYVGNAYRFIVKIIFTGKPEMLVFSSPGGDHFRLGKTSFLTAQK